MGSGNERTRALDEKKPYGGNHYSSNLLRAGILNYRATYEYKRFFLNPCNLRLFSKHKSDRKIYLKDSRRWVAALAKNSRSCVANVGSPEHDE
jgi:hypothetical protein